MESKILITFFTLLLIFAGCNRQNQVMDPACSDEVTKSEPVTACESKEVTINVPHRGWQERTVAYENVGLNHPALYLEGPFEKQGSNNGKFEDWDFDSAFSLVSSPAIFLGNVALWPFHMVVKPPFATQISRSDYPVQYPVHAIPAEPSRAARKNYSNHEVHEGHEEF